MQLYEKYRPKTFDDVLGQDKAVKKIRSALNNGWGSQAFWISGASGTGKSTLALIIAQLKVDNFFIRRFDSGDSVTVSDLDETEKTLCLYGGLFGGGKSGRAVIIDEAHGLRKNIMRRLLGLLERIPKHVVWIFTTTKTGLAGLFEEQIDAEPLLSRCIYIELTNQGLAGVFAERAKEIAEIEKLDGKPLSSYLQLVKDNHNNMRAVLQAIQSGLMLKD